MFGVEAQLVLVDVSVTKDGAAVPGLRKEDFTVFEDGVEQPLLHLEEVWTPGVGRPAGTGAYVALPRILVFVIDELHMLPNQAEEAKRALLGFLDSGARDGDRVAVVSTATGQIAGTQMPDNRASLNAFIHGLKGRYERHLIIEDLSEAEAFRIVKGDQSTKEAVGERLVRDGTVFAPRGSDLAKRAQREAYRLAVQVHGEAETRARSVLGILARALEWSAQWRGRKAFVLASNGFIYDPALPDFNAIARTAQRANGTVYFLDARRLGQQRGLGADRGPLSPVSGFSEAQVDLLTEALAAEVMANESGGFIVRNTNDLQGGLERIADDVSAYYLIGYEPPEGPRTQKELRRIEVRVAVPGVDVRHRKGY
jgi:VWFA-related protein